jgi:hypothetical protein
MLQLSAEAGILEQAAGACGLLVAHENPSRQESDGALERAHMFVGDDDDNLVFRQYRPHGGD